MQRITSDIDKKNRLIVGYYILKSLFNIRNIKRIEIIRSHHKKWHLIIWTTYPYKIRETFKLREMIGDDLHRLSMDKLRKFGRNTLFYKKEAYK